VGGQEDKTKLKLLYASRTAADILLRSELAELQRNHPEQFEVRYLVEHPRGVESPPPPAVGASGDIRIGRPGADSIRAFLPRPLDARTAVLVCGPEGMMTALCGMGSNSDSVGAPPRLGGLLRSMGYGRQVVQFSDTNSL
jgi:cytochrome-b5 reductase